jgi:5'-methylthioadenosine phosphorylase
MSNLRIGVIGGTGLGQLLGTSQGTRRAVETPFGPPSDAIVETEWEGLTVLLLNRHGLGHCINPSQLPSRANIFALKLLGCTHILAATAVGSLRQEFAPRDLVVPDQLIDRTTRRPNTFYETAAVHVEFAEPFCPVLRRIVLDAGKEIAGGFSIHANGCYLCMEGPAFSTRSESLMHRIWGGDVIGMTACPEAKLAREAEIPYCLVSLVTDFDCWKTVPADKPKPDAKALLDEIMANLQAASANAMTVIRAALRKISADPTALAACPAAGALKLAIWSDKAAIPPEEIRRLSPLWGKYFG